MSCWSVSSSVPRSIRSMARMPKRCCALRMRRFSRQRRGRASCVVHTDAGGGSARFTTEQACARPWNAASSSWSFSPKSISPLASGCVRGLLLAPPRWDARKSRSIPLRRGGFRLIVEINDWCWRAPLAPRRGWRASGHADLRVAINASSRQLADPALLKRWWHSGREPAAARRAGDRAD